MIGSVDLPVEIAGELFLGSGGAASGIRLGSDVALMEGLAAAMCLRWVGGAGGRWFLLLFVPRVLLLQMIEKASAGGAEAVMAQSRPTQSTMVVDRAGLRGIEFPHPSQGHEMEIAENH